MSMRQVMFGIALLAAPLLCGCRQFGNTEAGALVGTGLGATTGAIIGGESGHAGAGALIGAATGALAGGIVGDAADAREERDAAVAHAHYTQAQAQAQQQALTSGDVISMAHNGVSDEVIVNAVRTRGCRFSGDPQAIIQLKQSGISDRVIESMQTNPPHTPGPALAPGYVAGPGYAPLYGAAPPVVVVAPRPYPYYWGPRGRYWGPPGPYHRHGYW